MDHFIYQRWEDRDGRTRHRPQLIAADDWGSRPGGYADTAGAHVRRLKNGASITDPMGNSSNCYSFAEGAVISYGPLVERWKELAPIVDEADQTMTIFPQCRSWCNAVHERVTATMVLRNAGLPMDGQFFSFRIWDLIQHTPLIVRAAGILLHERDQRRHSCADVPHLQVSGAEGSALWLSKLSAHTKLYEGSFLQSTDIYQSITPPWLNVPLLRRNLARMLTLPRLPQLAALPALILVVPIPVVALSGRLQYLTSLTAKRRRHRGRRHRPTQGLPHHNPRRFGRFLRRRPAYRPGAAGLGPAACRLHHTLLHPALAGDRARPGPPSCRLPLHPLLPPLVCIIPHITLMRITGRFLQRPSKC